MAKIDASELTQSEVDKIILALELMCDDESKNDKKGIQLAEKISKAKRFIIVNK